MKVVFFLILAIAFCLLPAHTSFANPKKVYKAVTVQKSGKPGGNAQGAKKNSSSISGTGIRRKR